MPQLTLDDFAVGTPHLNKSDPCPGGKCRLGPAIHLQKAETQSHDAILHGLDRQVGNLFFGRGPFEPTIGAWDGIPIVYAQSHPDPRVFKGAGIAEQLDLINGAIIGETSHSRIELAGHPKLMLKKNYTAETAERLFNEGLITEEQLNRSKAAINQALDLWQSGKLSHSSGFICPDDGIQLTGVVTPNHILDFEETDIDQPKDRMSVILNKRSEGNNVIDTETDEDDTGTGTDPGKTNIGKVMSGKNQGRLKTILDAITDFFNDISGTAETTKTNATTPSVPPNPSGYKVGDNAADCKLTESQFGDMAFSEVRKRFAFDSGGETFTGLKLPHHSVDGTLRPNCVRAALQAIGGARSGSPMDLGGKKDAVVAHLENHMNEIKKQSEPGTKQSKLNQEVKMTDEDVTSTAEIETVDKSVYDAALAEKDEMIAQLQKEFAELKTAQEEAKKNKEDANWAKLKAEVIPKGLVKEEADEMDLRKLSKEDPLAFNLKIQEYRATDQFKEEGESHVSGPDKEVREQKEIDMVLEKDRGRNIPGRLH